MKINFFIAAAAAVAVCSCAQQSANAPASDNTDALLQIIEDIPTSQAFLIDPVPEADLQRILNAGINTPSAMNKQPWHFTVLSTPEAIAELVEAQKSSMGGGFPPMGAPGMKPGQDGPGAPAPGMGPGPGAPGAGPDGEAPKIPTGNGPRSGLGDSPVVILISCSKGGDFDAGLACEGMNVMANVLGYTTKIASSVTMIFRGDKKAELYNKYGIPEGQEIVTAVLLGKLNTEAYDAVSSATPRNPKDQVVTFVK